MYQLFFKTEVASFWFYLGEIFPPSSPFPFKGTALQSNTQRMLKTVTLLSCFYNIMLTFNALQRQLLITHQYS